MCLLDLFQRVVEAILRHILLGGLLLGVQMRKNEVTIKRRKSI